MPIFLPPISRRRFLAGAAGAAAAASGLLCGKALWGADDASAADPHRFALLSDLHIAADRTKFERKVNMVEHLTKVVAEVAALSPRPAACPINGDLAFGTGQAGDYAALLALLKPLREAGLPLHLGLGNHYHRDGFRAALPERDRAATPFPERQVYVVESPRANWFILDSLDVTNKVPGTVGEAQRKWLSDGLDARKDKPALVMVHHNPDTDPKHNGLTDTREVMDLIKSRPHVKALIFGHTHHWSIEEQDGIHLVNLPAVAYVFQDSDPSGWVDMKLSETGATLELRCVDRSRPQHGETRELHWRGA